ncbi:MAG: nucleotide sugar dehydrogenase [Rhodospirillales bacterium]|nr:nucleotide sugar dehydrogenase [Rhodospirillales bacterium]
MSHNRKISVVGLGYVGFPVAVAFGHQDHEVIAFDINETRITELKAGNDVTGEIQPSAIASANLVLTSDPVDLARADFHIVTVPTPITEAKRPDLSPLVSASTTVGRVLKKDDIVVYESTVYPGVTEDICVPVLEKESGLVCGQDFTVGYSPERINPGDMVHRFETITKVVSGQNAETLKIVSAVYSSVVTAGVHEAANIKTAEAAKVIENTQRDLNIALMNELAVIFKRMGIDTRDVLAAAGTKWNFLPFMPGLVGGHCIGVDPYYLTHKAEQLGYNPKVILAGRQINDDMARFVASEMVKSLVKSRRAGPFKVTVLGLTFKEDVPDFRNTKVVDVVRELEDYGFDVQVHDPLADPVLVEKEYSVSLVARDQLTPADAIVYAVSHKEYLNEGWELITSLLKEGEGFVSDVKGTLDRLTKPDGVELWRL